MTTGQATHAIISIDEDSIPLAPRQDIDDLKRRIESAASQSRFVEFLTAEGAHVSVLLSPSCKVRIAVAPDNLQVLPSPATPTLDDIPGDLL